MKKLINKLIQQFEQWLYEEEEITIGELYNRFDHKSIETYTPDGKLKFIEECSIKEYYVKSENEFVPIKACRKTIPYQTHKITMENGMNLQCADNHIVIDRHDNEVFVKDLNNNSILKTETGNSLVQSVNQYNDFENMYDLELEHTHTYYTNGILSHNSIIVGSFSLWLAIFYPNQNIVVMSNKGLTAKKFLKKLKLIYRYLPDFIVKTSTPLLTDAVHSLEFANHSIIESINTTEEGPRGDSLSLLIWDEAAFTPENIQDELWSGSSPAVNQNRLIMISTFKNDDIDNLFYRLYETSKNSKDSKFFVIDDMDWTTDPSRDDAWYEAEKSVYIHSMAKFHREYDIIPGIPDKCDFNVMKLLELEKKIKENPFISLIEENEDGLDIWEEPKSGINYVMGVDVSEGIEANSQACQIFKLDTLEQVAEFQNNTLEISDFGNVCYNLGNMYNQAFMIVERNNVGHGLLKVLEDSLYYPNLYIGEDNRSGVNTNGASKEKMFNYVSSAIVYDLFELKSIRLIKQMKLFRKKFTKAEKAKKKDDLVMALMVMMYGIVDLGLNNFFTEVLAQKLTTEEIGNKIKIIKDRIYKYQENKSDVSDAGIFF